VKHVLPKAAVVVAALLPLLAAEQRSGEPWSRSQLIQPAALAARISGGKAPKPPILFVGFPLLYAKHIPGAVFAGPGARPQGIEALKKAAATLPRDREVVIYCGCCPWQECPNIRPAFLALREMGFRQIRVLELPSSFYADWIQKGYPVEEARR
jgi:thiosulfate/3-mercaptopyruvate sulfurtransferase